MILGTTMELASCMHLPCTPAWAGVQWAGVQGRRKQDANSFADAI